MKCLGQFCYFLIHTGWIILVYLEAVASLYESSSGVVNLNPSTFNKLVINSDDVWVVEFFAPWCGHCQSLVPEYTKAAKALNGIVKVGAVNVDEYKPLGSQYGISGFPTIKIFGANKNKPEDYSGQRTAQAIVDAAFRAVRQVVDQRLGKKTGDSGGQSKASDANDVIELTDSNFEDTVIKSEDMWLVEFFAPWCGHCKNLAPHWASAASELKGKVKLGALDATVHTVMASRYGVRGYPTIKYFPAGKKDGSAEEYDGGRTSSDIVQWATDKLAANIPPPEIFQVTSAGVLKKSCEDHQLCIVSVLPHILDCQSQCRNDYLKTLRKLGEKFKKNMWGWLWVEAGAQLELESSLEIGGFGYPAMAAVNARKMKFALLRGSFSYDGIDSFLKELAYGRGSTMPMKGAELPKIVDTELWDGKDGKLEVEEDDYEDDSKDEL